MLISLLLSSLKRSTFPNLTMSQNVIAQLEEASDCFMKSCGEEVRICMLLDFRHKQYVILHESCVSTH